MELIYVWVRNYKNVLNNIGISFTTEHEINVSNIDENLYVKIQNRKSHKIMGENLEFFGIIGENGTGKTSILKCIIGQDFNGFSIYKIENDVFKIIRNEKFIIKFEGYKVIESPNENNDYSEYLIYQDDDGLKNNNSKFNLIYYDNIFNIKEIYKGSLGSFIENYDYNDISITHQLYHNNNGNLKKQSISDIENIIWYFYKNSKNKLKIKNPNKLKIKHTLDKNIIEKHSDFVSYNTFEDAIIKNFVYNFLKEYDLLEKDKTLGKYDSIFINLFNVFKNDSIEKIKYFINQNFIYKTNGKDYDNERVLIFDRQLNHIEKYSEIIKIIKNFKEKNIIIVKSLNKKEIDIEIEFSKDKILEFLNFLEVCKNYELDISFLELNYEKEFSSGELAIINIFSKLYKSIETIKEIDGAILILMDEPDIFLHPEWQRKFISNLLDLCVFQKK